MKKQIQKTLNETRMNTMTSYFENGKINIYPCSFEEEKVVTTTTRRIRGSMMVLEDGTAYFTPVQKGTVGNRYAVAYATDYGSVRTTKRDVIVTFRYPKRFGQLLSSRMLDEEAEEIYDYLNSKKGGNVWS